MPPGSAIDRLPTPALLLDLDRLERNLARMESHAAALGVALRPHVKTHKCVEIAERQRALGAVGLTVSTLYEAEVFADHGFDDITWAYPVALNRLDQVEDLAQRVRLRLVVDSMEAVKALARLECPLHVWLKVDCGYHRAGVDPRAVVALEIAHALRNAGDLVFDGILCHSGHAYHVRSRDALAAIAEDERRIMVAFAERLREEDIAVPAISVGSTPAMSAVEGLDGVTEARPGNYALFDYSQCVIGSCSAVDVAATVLASVVSSPSHGDHSIVDAGALALSKDPGAEQAPRPSMGQIFEDYGRGELREDVYLKGLSQEHGIVHGSLPVGTQVRILPNHACLTVAHFDEFYVVRGQEIVDRWKVWRGRA